MEVDIMAFFNAMIMARMNAKSPQAAKIFAVFEKRGIPVMEAMLMLSEICAIADEMEGKNEET